MTDLILYAVLHDQKNYHLFTDCRLKILIKLFAKMKSRSDEYFEINIECMLYTMYVIDYIHTKYQIINFNLKYFFFHGYNCKSR